MHLLVPGYYYYSHICCTAVDSFLLILKDDLYNHPNSSAGLVGSMEQAAICDHNPVV